MKAPPCDKYCPNRDTWCHRQCDKYAKWAKERNEYLKKRYAWVKEDGAYRSRIFSRVRTKR